MLTASFSALAGACRARLPGEAADAIAVVLDHGVAALTDVLARKDERRDGTGREAEDSAGRGAGGRVENACRRLDHTEGNLEEHASTHAG